MNLRLGSQSLTLLPEKALLLDSTLVLADTHFGKSATFRARGIPIPEGDTECDTQRMVALIENYRPRHLVIAGDFLHASEGKSPHVLAALSTFFAQVPCACHLVLGNHDRRAGRLPPHWDVAVHDRYEIGDVTVVHDPDDAPKDRYSICGHLHPVARIRDGRHAILRTQCFWLSERQLVLPSFGSFTGGAVVRPGHDDRVFAPLRDRVVEIPAHAL